MATVEDFLRPGSTDPDRAESAFVDLYQAVELSVPEFHWVMSPKAGVQRLSEIKSPALERSRDEVARYLASGLAQKGCFCRSCEGASVTQLTHAIPPTDWSDPYRSWGVQVDRLILEELAVGDSPPPRRKWGERDRLLRHQPFSNPWEVARAVRDNHSTEDSETPNTALGELAASAGWWWPFVGLVVLSARPVEVHFRDQQVHNAAGPAIVFPDGWSVAAILDTRVDQEFFEPGGLTIDRILGQQNLEIRRHLIEAYGHERFVKDAGGTLVAEDEAGQLWQLTGGMLAVRVVDSTPMADGTHRVYWLHVPPGMRSARAAVAWTFGLAEHEYKPVQET